MIPKQVNEELPGVLTLLSRNAATSGFPAFDFSLKRNGVPRPVVARKRSRSPDSLRCSATIDRHWVSAAAGRQRCSQTINKQHKTGSRPATAASGTFWRHINLSGEAAGNPRAADSHKRVLRAGRFNQRSKVCHRQFGVPNHTTGHYRRYCR